MRKTDELERGCMSNAFDDEMTFVLLARDAAAPDTIRAWANARIVRGLNRPEDDQIVEALQCADRMDAEQSLIRARCRKLAS